MSKNIKYKCKFCQKTFYDFISTKRKFCSLECRVKSQIGRKLSAETKQKISKSETGKIISEETRNKLSKRMKGKKSFFLGCKHSEKSKEKNRQAHLGEKNVRFGAKLSEEHKKKLVNSIKGKSRLEETKEKLRQFTGIKASNWRGGISFEPYSIKWTKQLRRSIRKKDAFICQECKIHQNKLGRQLDIHHIDYDKKNCNPNNLIALCRNCHAKTNFERLYWRIKFEKLKRAETFRRNVLDKQR